MPADFEMGDRLGHLVDRILDSYYADERTRHIDRAYLPSRDEIMDALAGNACRCTGYGSIVGAVAIAATATTATAGEEAR